MDLCQKSCVVIGHFEGEARPAEVFIAVFCLDAGEGEVCFCRVLQTYRDEKLNAVIIILRDRSAVICFQHPLRLPQCPVKKLDFHDAVADRFRKTLAILCFLKNVLILWNNIQSDFFNDPATTEIYTLSLRDALPISATCSVHDIHVISAG